MEIEIERKTFVTALVVIGLIAVLTIGALGRAVTPEGDRVLTWGEWKILNAQKVYVAELQELRKASDELAGLLNNRPDPVRVQMQVDRLEKNLVDGQASLSEQRAALFAAAEAIRSWSLGQIAREQAVSAHAQSVEILQPTAQK